MRFRIVFIACILFFTFLVGLHIFYSYRDTGMLSYPLDDAFIHMAISKNLALHGVWGITRFEFSSTSSSVFYTVILALGFLVAGVKVWMPLAINYIVGLIILYFTSRVSSLYISRKISIIWHLLFILMVPLGGMAVLGMEHTLQILTCLLFIYQTWQLWKGERVHEFLYLSTAILAVATRYESAFLIGLAAASWLFIFGNVKRALLLLIAVAVPVIVFGWFSVSHGGFFFPNSLLAKSNFINGSVSAYLSVLAGKILSTGLLFSFLFLPLLFWWQHPIDSWKKLRSNPKHLLFLLIAATSVSHFVLASYGWLFRYEAYLVSMLFFAMMLTWDDWSLFFKSRHASNKLVLLLLGGLMLFPILSRVQMISHTRRATKNIADQQVQMARFVNAHFPDRGIAMNDIGALSFFNENMRIFDMEGLGTAEVIRKKKRLDSSFLSAYVAKHDITIGIFYPHLYKEKIPSSWKQVGTWELTDNFVTGGSVVGFYAIDPAEIPKLKYALQQHGPLLPPNVIQKINPD